MSLLLEGRIYEPNRKKQRLESLETKSTSTPWIFDLSTDHSSKSNKDVFYSYPIADTTKKKYVKNEIANLLNKPSAQDVKASLIQASRYFQT
jgi:hypothetical protein